ncbi:MAG: hypothetical protein ACRDHZ_05120, partial [Ktedonobacteraceae bacterium]
MAEFAELRAQISIERVFTDILGVTDFKKIGTRQLLGTCPSCGSRALKVTPSMGMSNCFGPKCAMGGDIIKVVALAKKLSLTDAGNAIAAHFGIGSSRPIRSGAPATSAGTFDPIEYQKKLDPENVALLPLGIA